MFSSRIPMLLKFRSWINMQQSAAITFNVKYYNLTSELFDVFPKSQLTPHQIQQVLSFGLFHGNLSIKRAVTIRIYRCLRHQVPCLLDTASLKSWNISIKVYRITVLPDTWM
jgi:hypothetical protein